MVKCLTSEVTIPKWVTCLSELAYKNRFGFGKQKTRVTVAVSVQKHNPKVRGSEVVVHLLYLFEVDTLARRVGPSDDLDSAIGL